ncbi:fasciclin [Fulvitalea axinellae]|uniref:Fasciclin n=1 Tax=Fulvitalea axinellae TaxID=1182444 RepID=A0AAU9CM34_9BACT|nr:fasciclin [Fulvitalea axinellae]
MKRKFYRIPLLLLFIAIGCQTDLDEHYEIPDTLGERLVTAMEAQGDLTQFVKAIDLLGIRKDLEKSSYTVFPPTDEAMVKYMKDKHGVEDVAELSEQDREMLVTAHIVRNSMSWDQMLRLNIFHTGSWGEKPGEGGTRQEIGVSWGFKLPTVYSPPQQEIYDAKAQKTRKVRHFTTYLPVMYYDKFSGMLEEGDYTFFFPDSEYTGFNVHAAVAVRPNIKALNGVIHVLDRPVPALVNAETFLAKTPEYSLFYELMNRFAVYEYDAWATRNQIGDVKDSVFTKTYRTQNALDWVEDDKTYHTGGYDEWLGLLNVLTVPDNETLKTYLTESFVHENGYASIEEIPDGVIKPLVSAHGFNTHNIASWIRPSQLDNFVNGIGQPTSLDKDKDVNFATILNNAAFYGLNKVIEPNLYKAVTRKMLFDRRFSYMLDISYRFNSSVTTLMTSPEWDGTIFMPTNEAFEASGYSYDEETDTYFKEDNFGDKEELSDNELQELLQMHMVLGRNHDNTSGRQFAKTLAIGNYLRVKDGKVRSGGNYEQGEELNIVASDASGVNGTFYEIDGVLDVPQRSLSSYVLSPLKDEYSEFRKILERAGYVNGLSISKLQNKENITVLIPTNEALIRNRDKIPEDQVELRQFIDYHFVQDAVIFTDGEESGNFYTLKEPKRKEFETVSVENSVTGLVFRDGNGNGAVVVDDPRFSNILAKGGTVHLIDNVLFGQ